jgi:hypothetical protein
VKGVVAVALAMILAACSSSLRPPAATGELVAPGTAISAAVNEYFYLRERAIVARDAETLWSRYPRLRSGEDLAAGVNTEGWEATRADASRGVADVVYELERYVRGVCVRRARARSSCISTRSSATSRETSRTARAVS